MLSYASVTKSLNNNNTRAPKGQAVWWDKLVVLWTADCSALAHGLKVYLVHLFKASQEVSNTHIINFTNFTMPY